MKEFVNLVYHDINQQYAIPSALSSLFLTVASFHPTEFENNLFADEEYGWFYDSILNTREYKRSSLNNLKNMIEEDDPLSNLSLDEVDIEEPWENEFGKIMFPGDPSADPANTYNCRCSMSAKVIGFKKVR